MTTLTLRMVKGSPLTNAEVDANFTNLNNDKAPLANPTFTGTVGGITKAMVGLGNVDNTTDANKPISTATQTALDNKAPLASPAFTGTPTVPTAAAGTNTTQAASTAFVTAAITASGGLPASPTFTGDVTVGGNLTVNGTTTTINSTTITVDDKNLELGSVTTPTDTTANGGGITLKAATDKTFNWVSSTNRWTSNVGIEISTGQFTGSGAGLTAIPLTTAVSGILPIANGGTGSSSTTFVSLTTNVTGTLPVTNGGTGVTTSTGSGNNVLSTSPTLVTPVLGIPTSGTLSNCTVDGTYKVGYREVPQTPQSANYTAVLEDSGKHIYHPSADTTARTYTIPANASVAYPVGTVLTFVNDDSAGVLTIDIATDTMRLAGEGTTGSRTLAANGVATAIKITATSWIISGTNLT